MKPARVKEVLSEYRTGGIKGVYEYLSRDDIEIYEGTWIHKIKKLLEAGNIASCECEISYILFTFKLSENDL
jgi:hypothetical protein